MTAPAAAPASGPIAPAAPRAAPQPPADRFAFAAMLDSLPGAQAKAGASTAEEQPHSFERTSDRKSLRADRPARHSLLNDSALLASLPFALRASSMMGERPQAADNSPSPDLAGDERAEIRGQRRIPCRWGQGGDCRAADWRTRFSLWRLPFPGRDHEPRSPGRQAVRAGLRLRRQSYVPSRSKREKRPRCWLPASLRPCRRNPSRTLFHPATTRRPRRRSPLAQGRRHQIA